MFATRLGTLTRASLVGVGKAGPTPTRVSCLLCRNQQYATGRASTLRKVRGATLKERITAPAGQGGELFINLCIAFKYHTGMVPFCEST